MAFLCAKKCIFAAKYFKYYEEQNYNIALTQIALDRYSGCKPEKMSGVDQKAAAQGANVVCLPELYSSFYFCQSENHDYFELAEPLHNDSYKAFSALAAELGIVLIVPFFERRASGLYHNSAYIIDTDGSQAGLYRKMHIPDDPSYYEKFYFTPGDIGFKAFDTQVGKIGTLICWDQWYPEGARITSLQGAEVLFYPTAIGWHPHEKAQYGVKQHDACAPFNADMRLPTVFLWQPATVWDSRNRLKVRRNRILGSFVYCRAAR